MARIKIDLHAIYNNSAAIDKALQQAFDDAIEKKIREVEIIPGKGSGQLRKKVERFLQQPHIVSLKIITTLVRCWIEFRNAQVSDTTNADSSNNAHLIIISILKN